MPPTESTVNVGLWPGLAVLAALAAVGLVWFGGRLLWPAPPPSPAPPPAEVRHAPGTGMTAAFEPYIGAADAPVTVIEYSDYQCPNCRQFAQEVLPWLRQVWIARGLVKVVYRDFAIRGSASHLAAEAAHCAGDQGRYWAYHDALFERQPDAPAAFEAVKLEEMARQLGLDLGEFSACLEARRHRGRVESSTQAAHARGFNGTPTFEVNGQLTEGAIPVERWNELFQAYQADLGGR